MNIHTGYSLTLELRLPRLCVLLLIAFPFLDERCLFILSEVVRRETMRRAVNCLAARRFTCKVDEY